MYTLALAIHSWMRWAAIGMGVVATFAALTGRSSEGDAKAERYGKIFVIVLDIQFLLGVLLYFVLSPNTKAILNDFGAAMKDPVARFWAVEHVVMMVLAVAIAHMGKVMARKAANPRAKQMRLTFGYMLATILLIAGTPWPGTKAGRPMIRL